MAVSRRALIASCLGLTAGALAFPGLSLAEDSTVGADVDSAQRRFFRIGTGSPAGSYYPLGGLIATAISEPEGANVCGQGGACGVPGLIAVAQATAGSVDNLQRLAAGKLESALCQEDVAYWAYRGEGAYAKQAPQSDLRILSYLLPEYMHIVVRANAGIVTLKDLVGKRVSLDRAGSGTQLDALLLLEAAGIAPKSLALQELSTLAAAQALRDGSLDAFFMVTAVPSSLMASLAEEQVATLLPIPHALGEKVAAAHPFLHFDVVPSGYYRNVAAAVSLSTGALWLTTAALSDDLAFEIVRAFWRPEAQSIMQATLPELAGQISLDRAGQTNDTPPLHPGAQRFLRDVLGEDG